MNRLFKEIYRPFRSIAGLAWAHILGLRRWQKGGRIDLQSARSFHNVEWRWLSVRQFRRLLPKLGTVELSHAMNHLRRGVCTELAMSELLHRAREIDQNRSEIETAFSAFPNRYLVDLIQRADPEFLCTFAHLFCEEARCRILTAAISSASDPVLWREKGAAFLRGLRSMTRRGEEILSLFTHFGAEQLAAAFEVLSVEEIASLIFPPEEEAVAVDLTRRIGGCGAQLLPLQARISERLRTLRVERDRIEALDAGEIAMDEYEALIGSLERKRRGMRDDLDRLRRLRQSLLLTRSGLRKARGQFEASERIVARLMLFVQLQPVGEALFASPYRVPFEELDQRVHLLRTELIHAERQQREVASILTGRAAVVQGIREEEAPPKTTFRRLGLLDRLDEKASHLERPQELDEESWILPLWDALTELRSRLPSTEEGLHALLGAPEHRLTLPLLRGFVEDRSGLDQLGVSTFSDLRGAVERRVREMVTTLFPVTEEEWRQLPWEMVGCNFKQADELRAAGVTSLADLHTLCKEHLFELLASLAPDEFTLQEAGLQWQEVARVVYCEAHVEQLSSLDQLRLYAQASRPS